MSDRRRMRPRLSIRRALTDKRMLGKALSGPTWRAWRILLMACMGEELTPAELKVFEELTGRSVAPSKMVSEACFVIGRRGGKSRALAVLAVYLSCLCDHRVDAGETAITLIIAMDRDQASVCLSYALAAIEQSVALRSQIKSKTSDAITLTNGVAIEVRSPSFRRLRGRTAIAVLCDEVAFWYSNESSANPDSEIINAVKPMLATTGGPLLLASSPYARRGVLHDVYKTDYGPKGDPRVLVAQAASLVVNPSLDPAVVARAMEKDEASALAEYGAQFRTDISSWLDIDRIRACVDDDVYERGPILGMGYHAFVDVASGSGSDSTALCIVHQHGEKVVVDLLWEVKPPFSPAQATSDMCGMLKRYGITGVIGDNYAGGFVPEGFGVHGIVYKVSDKPKSVLYTELLPKFNQGSVLMLDHKRTIAQLAGLERRTSFGGIRDKVDHGPGGHDDLCNVLAGAVVNVGKGRGMVREGYGGSHKILLGHEKSKQMSGRRMQGQTSGGSRRGGTGMSIKHEIELAGMVQSERKNIGPDGYQIEKRQIGGDGREKWMVFNPAGMEMGATWGKENAIDMVEQLTKKGVVSRGI